MNQIFEGNCACGQTRYRMQGAPMFVHCCHCRDCQRQSGSAFAIHGLIEAERLQCTAGETVVATLPTGSGGRRELHGCSNCRTTLWTEVQGRRWMRIVKVATLDQASEFPPDVHIFTRSKLPFVVLGDQIPGFEAFYDMAALWPAESLARRKAAEARAG